MLFWTFASADFAVAGALPPEPCDFSYGRPRRESPYLSRSEYGAKWQALEAGFRVEPSDCPPMRAMARTGFLFRCPRFVEIEGQSFQADRQFEAGSSRHAAMRIRGESWPRSDSGYVASWIAGSVYLKIQTGILLICPRETSLLQGPIPNADLEPASLHLRGYFAIEHFNQNRAVRLKDREYYAVEMNFIYRVPNIGEAIKIDTGTPVGWVLALAEERLRLEPLAEDLLGSVWKLVPSK